MKKDINSVFKDYFGEGLKKSGSALRKSQEILTRNLNESDSDIGFSIDDIQLSLRPIFGKSLIRNEPRIGGHPDFDHLENTENVENASVVTLFMDMESSTRLGVLYSPEDVFRIKNTFIRMAIDVIKSFDGHVHRIMGDAILAFFGGRNTDENNVADALNCASMLIYVVKFAVIPKLEEEGFTDNEFGVRIGLDYGGSEHVIWSSYGHYNMSEVTATSFFVDIASKLQSSAGRNQVVIGQSLKEFIDFPDNFLRVKEITINGEVEKQHFVTPNITDRDGRPINYRKFILLIDEYLNSTPFRPNTESVFLPATTNHFLINIQKYDLVTGNYEGDLLPGSVFVDKDKSLKFTVRLNYLPQLPFKVIFSVENTGKEAKEKNVKDDGSSDFGNHSKPYFFTQYSIGSPIVHTEKTLYRGFQHMTILVQKENGSVLHNVKMGIYIK